MKLLFDLLPVIIFFAFYKLFNLYVATAAAIVTSAGALIFYWVKHRKFDALLLMSSALVIILGSITLLLHNDIFIKWKPTAISWLFGLAFLISEYVSDKSIIRRIMETALERSGETEQLILPEVIWHRLNLAWVGFYFLIGALNLIFVYRFSTDAWVNFKLFGVTGLTLLFLIGQASVMSKFMVQPKEKHRDS